ncbi:hypothetical protein EYF80_027255 [Liparis tanakae]|uniref:Uncharacterized protein n=1 Tax=Liparis tanakae TaxID=230148 RepID=A0A4Z2HCP8_9TELE|nr:hypothetical protein EYF80_027255 [Liparis tanakae]
MKTSVRTGPSTARTFRLSSAVKREAVSRLTLWSFSRRSSPSGKPLRLGGRMAEHCRGTPIILCGFHVTELALQG